MKKNKKEFSKFIKNNWQYYLNIERELYEYRNEVEFDNNNLGAFSFHLLKIYMTICSEIDNVGKYMAIYNNPALVKYNDNNKPIPIYFDDWWKEVKNVYVVPDNDDWFHCDERHNINTISLLNKKCSLLFNDKIYFYPWSDTAWWGAYNSLKHNRSGISTTNNELNYKMANLKNVLSACAGLYLLETAFMIAIGTANDFDKVDNVSILFDRPNGIRIITISYDDRDNIFGETLRIEK